MKNVSFSYLAWKKIISLKLKIDSFALCIDVCVFGIPHAVVGKIARVYFLVNFEKRFKINLWWWHIFDYLWSNTNTHGSVCIFIKSYIKNVKLFTHTKAFHVHIKFNSISILYKKKNQKNEFEKKKIFQIRSLMCFNFVIFFLFLFIIWQFLFSNPKFVIYYHYKMIIFFFIR